MILHKGAKIAGRENFKSQGIRTTGALTYTEAAHGLWPELPPEHAANFTSVDPVWLKPGTPLYRVFGEFGEKAKLDGNYWSTEKPPNTELEWRNGQAVWKDWNTGKQFTEMRVGPKGLKIWEGIVAPQSRSRLSGVDTQHLPGGGRQVYFPVGQFGIAEPGPNPAPWHSH